MLKKSDNEQISFADFSIKHKEKRWNSHWLKKVDDLINWKPFEKRLNKLYSKCEGRPAWEPILLFKCLLLSKWYTLSDRQLEEAMEFRIDFCKFVGLSLEKNAPDATTFSIFRQRIERLWKKFMSILNRQLEGYGYKIEEAISVDATLVEAHKKPTGKDKDGDDEASWRGFPQKKIEKSDGTVEIARRSALYCYKINLACSVKEGFISNIHHACLSQEHRGRLILP